jgi:diguanylate cyclase (GGDEF)-like protein
MRGMAPFVQTLDNLRAATTHVVVAAEAIDASQMKNGTLTDHAHLLDAARTLDAMVHDRQTSAFEDGFGADPDDRTLATLRHDLRALVNAVKGYAELLIEDLDASECDLARGLLQVVDAAMRATPVIDRLRRPNAIDPLPERTDTSAPPVAEEPRFEGRRVLVIDDTEANRTLLARRLSRAGLDVLTAADGETGLTLARTGDVDLVLCDVIMPGFDGFGVLRALKNDPLTQAIPVLMISAVREDESIARCIEAGADDYVTVPFDRAVLHARINACLNRRVLLEQNRKHLAELEETRAELIAAIESMDNGFALWDVNETLRACNQRFRAIYPAVPLSRTTTLESWVTGNVRAGVFLLERRGTEPRDETESIASILDCHRRGNPLTLGLRDGSWIAISCRGSDRETLVTVHEDVTERKHDEARLTWLAMHDPLTNLANRALFEHHLAEACAGVEPFALLYVDLDGFKLVNDTLGHDAGDRLLIRIADVLRESVRSADLVSRIGGDEFCIILANTPERDDVTRVAERIITSIGTRYDLGTKSVAYGTSIGIAHHTALETGTIAPDQILMQADMAMYAAKKAGKSRYYVHGDRLT